jgi:hypothetical protein
VECSPKHQIGSECQPPMHSPMKHSHAQLHTTPPPRQRHDHVKQMGGATSKSLPLDAVRGAGQAGPSNSPICIHLSANTTTGNVNVNVSYTGGDARGQLRTAVVCKVGARQRCTKTVYTQQPTCATHNSVRCTHAKHNSGSHTCTNLVGVGVVHAVVACKHNNRTSQVISNRTTARTNSNRYRGDLGTEPQAPGTAYIHPQCCPRRCPAAQPQGHQRGWQGSWVGWGRCHMRPLD